MTKAHAKKLAIRHIAAINQHYIWSYTLIFHYFQFAGIDPPKAANEDGFLLRLTCVDWWTRKLIAKDLKDKESGSRYFCESIFGLPCPKKRQKLRDR